MQGGYSWVKNCWVFFSGQKEMEVKHFKPIPVVWQSVSWPKHVHTTFSNWLFLQAHLSLSFICNCQLCFGAGQSDSVCADVRGLRSQQNHQVLFSVWCSWSAWGHKGNWLYWSDGTEWLELWVNARYFVMGLVCAQNFVSLANSADVVMVDDRSFLKANRSQQKSDRWGKNKCKYAEENLEDNLLFAVANVPPLTILFPWGRSQIVFAQAALTYLK